MLYPKSLYKPDFSVLKDDFSSADPDFFKPYGTYVFVGRQGSGKTISAMRYLKFLMALYPKALVVSNVQLHELKARTFVSDHDLINQVEAIKLLSGDNYQGQYIRFSGVSQADQVLRLVNNGIYGVIYFIDEIHSLFNSLESKSIPISIMAEISQQRKQRKHILGTSQLFMRMAKPFREQCDLMIVCKNYLNSFTINKIVDPLTVTFEDDGSMTGKPQKTVRFWQTRELRDSFDTYQKINTLAETYPDFEFDQKMELKIDKKLAKKLGKL